MKEIVVNAKKLLQVFAIFFNAFVIINLLTYQVIKYNLRLVHNLVSY